MNRSTLLALILVLGWGVCTRVTADSPTRPNIIFILADDLGYGDLACYGRTDIRTPRLDGLAKRGVRFTAHYANGPECSPTRAAFLTGRYQQWIGGLECAIGTGNLGRYDDAMRLRDQNDLGLPTSTPTIVRLLKESGYETAITGKWHLGYEPKFAPHLHGFDRTLYCIGGEMDYFHYLDLVAGYNLFRDGQPIRAEGYFTDLMTDEAIKFIGEARSAPYFLYVPYTCPHAPFQGPNDRQPHPLPLDSPLWKQGSAPPDVYLAMIERMDACIGRIVDAVQAQGEAQIENTLIIFASDNGGTGSARNDPYSGIKGSTYEGGIRVPAIAVWPGRIPQGLRADQVCITFDLTRSIAELAGVAAPESHRFEGMDILRHVCEGQPDVERTLFWRKPRGDQIWKGVRSGDWKYVAHVTGDEEEEFLFDLARDPAEQNSLLEQQAGRARALREQYEEWEFRTRQNRRGRP